MFRLFLGYALPHATSRLDVAGSDLTDYIMKILSDDDYYGLMKSCNGREIARDIKERLCYVTKDFESDMNKNIESKYALPDGKFVTIGPEQYGCGEALFKPLLIGKYCDGIHKKTYESVMKCDGDIRVKLCESIILSGGCTMMKGLKHRFKKELMKLLPSKFPKPHIIASPQRQIAAFIGGSILSSVSFFDGWTSRDEYYEGLFHRKNLKQNPTSVRYSVVNNDENDKNDNISQLIAATK